MPYEGTVNGLTVTGVCDGAPNLGEELWAYIPYNLQPHLKCLADKPYTHKYFVDHKPRIFDVQIFKEDDVHPGGWGTILVGSMGFGGAPIQAEPFDDGNGNTVADVREFSSSFFILDITNPEEWIEPASDIYGDIPPILLGELTRTTELDGTSDKYVDLNYTTSTPAMVIMRDGEEGNRSSKWYLVMGNGPSDLDGSNDDDVRGKLAILPLEWLKGEIAWANWTAGIPTGINENSRKSIRILNKEPDTTGNTTQGGVFFVPKGGDSNDDPGYISDIISVDYNIETTDLSDGLGVRYRTDAIYFGTVDGSNFLEYKDDDAPTEQSYWNGGGRIFRLVTKVLGTDSNDSDTYKKEINSEPGDWADRWEDNAYSEGPIRMLLDVKRPITAGPSIGYDGENYWVYAGTGRFFDGRDKTDDGWCIGGDSPNGDCWDVSSENRVQAAMFGVKEPTADARSGSDWGWVNETEPSVSCDDKVFTWQTVAWDRTSQDNEDLAPANAPGKRGLMKTDDILVASNSGILDCQHCTTNVATGDYDCVTSETCFPDENSSNFIDDLIKDGGGYTFDKLQQYIAGVGCGTVGSLLNNSIISQLLHDAIVPNLVDTDSKSVTTGIDGWYHEFHDPRERNLGAAALLGGLLTFTSYQPFNDKCEAEGESFLYGLHYQTGTAWTQSVFGTFNSDGSIKQDSSGAKINPKLSLGRGLSTTPSMHVGSSDDHAAKAFIQTSTGEIIEVTQKELPYTNTKSGRMGWTDRCE
ncbi:hypothetical protein GKODMF_05705 [Candidatus Electrothrix gigas]